MLINVDKYTKYKCWNIVAIVTVITSYFYK